MVYARFDYETARPLNDFKTTVIQVYYALYDLNKTLARCIRSRCVLSAFSAEPALPAKIGVPLGVYKVAVETTNQYTCSGVKGKGTVFNFLFFLGVPGAFFGVLLALGACMMRGLGGVW